MFYTKDNQNERRMRIKMKVECYDVWIVDFGDDPIGSEQGGIRPAIIFQNIAGNTYGETTIVIPLTKHIKKLTQPTHTLIKKGEDNNLAVDSMALAEGIRQVSFQRLQKYVGRILSPNDRREIRRIYIANMPK